MHCIDHTRTHIHIEEKVLFFKVIRPLGMVSYQHNRYIYSNGHLSLDLIVELKAQEHQDSMET